MPSQEGICRVGTRGIYSCHWRRQSKRRQKVSTEEPLKGAGCWLAMVSMVSIITLVWMYICFIAFNDQSDVNWKAFKKLRFWVNWYLVVIILASGLAMYCFLLLLLALLQLALKVPLDLHWLHKVLLFVGLLLALLGIAAVSFCWAEEWLTIRLSLQAAAPFLQLGAVGALTLISWLVFDSCHRAQKRATKLCIMAVFTGVCTAVFLCPLLIRSPCLVDVLPPKPALVGHRGAPMLAPENTMMAFRRSLECNVTAFETDVQLSKDMIPFLMHDADSRFLERTTNVTELWPEREYNKSTDFTWKELQELNAGNWFLKTDPFLSLSSLSKEDRRQAGEQTVPSLDDLLDLAKQHDTALIFDLKNDNNFNDTFYTVKTINNSGISPGLIWWLPPSNRQYVQKVAPRFQQVYNNVSIMEEDGGNFLNLKYSAVTPEEIGKLRSKNVTVNLWIVNERWLFSLLWCSGASSVTTNSCQLLRDVPQPDWHLRPDVYRIIWISVDLVSLLLMSVLFFLLRRKSRFPEWISRESERTAPLLNF